MCCCSDWEDFATSEDAFEWQPAVVFQTSWKCERMHLVCLEHVWTRKVAGTVDFFRHRRLTGVIFHNNVFLFLFLFLICLKDDESNLWQNISEMDFLFASSFSMDVSFVFLKCQINNTLMVSMNNALLWKSFHHKQKNCPLND